MPSVCRFIQLVVRSHMSWIISYSLVVQKNLMMSRFIIESTWTRTLALKLLYIHIRSAIVILL